MKVCKLSVCKEPTLYQSVHENVSESLLHSLFLHKTIQLSPFDLQSTARCPPFYELVTLSHFPWTTALTRTFATAILWCYNFNGMIKWYDISCATLYVSPNKWYFEGVCWIRPVRNKVWFGAAVTKTEHIRRGRWSSSKLSASWNWQSKKRTLGCHRGGEISWLSKQLLAS